MLDLDGDANPLDDILEMAGKAMRWFRGAPGALAGGAPREDTRTAAG